MPVVPATQEAEAGELLETGEVEAAGSWDCATALGDKVRPCFIKTKQNKQNTLFLNVFSIAHIVIWFSLQFLIRI